MQTMQSIGILLGAAMIMSVGCQLIAGVNTDATYAEPNAGGAGGTTLVSAEAGTSSSGNGGGFGGTGGSPECAMVKDCVVDECNPAQDCKDGVCVRMKLGNGALVQSQLYGDCQNRVCDANGVVASIPGDTDKDFYNWGNPCFWDACNAPSMPMPNDSMSCTTPWGNPTGTCNNFKCIECLNNMSCAGKACVKDRCVPMTCTDTVSNGMETDVDCGGLDCPPCTANKACISNSDCEGSCDSLTLLCVAPSCTDGVRNGDETDVDCGGSCAMEMPAKRCAVPMNGKINCLFPTDCESGVCFYGRCQNAHCFDYTVNQGEEGIDCGGPCAPCPKP